MRNPNFYKFPIYDNDKGEKVVILDDFEFSTDEEMTKAHREVYLMQQEVQALSKMSFEDIALMIDTCCELKRRIIKAVQGVRNEKFIKAIHSDYFAKSQF